MSLRDAIEVVVGAAVFLVGLWAVLVYTITAVPAVGR